MITPRQQRHITRNGCFYFKLSGLSRGTLPDRRRLRSRRGAVMVEGAIVMSVFIALTLGAVDLQMGVYRYNTLAQAARHGVRQAVVHGELATPATTAWGPQSYSGTASDGSPHAAAVKPMLVGIPHNAVKITVEWLDTSNAVGKRVRYSLETPYQPFLGFFIGYPSFTLKAASTMSIAH